MVIDLTLAYRDIEADTREELDEDARVVRGILMATRRVYHQQFIASGLPVNEQTVGFLPAHSLSRISAQFPEWVKTGLSFNNVSDRPRNPANQADPHELSAMEWFRRNPEAKERITDIRDANGRNFHHYTAPIWIEAYCLICHGKRENAPPSIRENYASSYDYQLGDLRGVMSIKLPMDELEARSLDQWKEQYLVRAGAYVVLLLLINTLMYRLVIVPVKHLEKITQRLGTGDLDARADLPGGDEISRLATSINDMAGAISEHDAQVTRLNRIYAALSHTNQTIVRTTDEAELLHKLCRIVVEFGGMSLVWIGKRDVASGKIVPHESHGTGLSYLAGLAIDMTADSPESLGPTATAWRTNRPVIVQDFFADATTRHWHERARRFNWGSSAAFPIVRDKEVCYTLNLYHADRMAFDDRMQDLLGEIAMDIGYALDRIDMIARQDKTDTELKASENKYRNILATSQDGFWLVDSDGNLLETNDAYLAISGYSRAELLHMKISDLEANENPDEVKQHIARLREAGSDVFETRHRTKSGAIKPVEVSSSVLSLEEGTFSVFIRDLSSRREAEARIQRLSHFDPLTGLPNRELFGDLVRQAIGQASRNRETLALVFIDIDHFKNVNDTLGHRVGDKLLIELTERFQGVLRSEDTLSRLGGDEFLVLLPHNAAEDAAHVAERLIASTLQSVRIDGHELLATPSLGIALYPADGDDFETLLQKADTATNRAKDEGRNTYRFFTTQMQHRSARMLHLEASLRRALERDELLLHYQPQVDLTHGSIIGMEALIRWRHPELGLVSPAEFIPIAESSGLILPIGEWVLKTALLQLKELMTEGLPCQLVAVNLSAVQFRHDKLPERIMQILEETGMPAHCLELELTEGLTMENPTGAIAMMDQLHRHGIRLSIDDFGTGYSSLSYLKRFRIDKLKIDQSFIRDLTHDPEGEAIVEAIVKLASTLGFRTIAEGVETIEQLSFLRGCECDEVQGYYFSRPLPPDALITWLRDWKPELARKTVSD